MYLVPCYMEFYKAGEMFLFKAIFKIKDSDSLWQENFN